MFFNTCSCLRSWKLFNQSGLVTPANMPIPNAFWYVNEQVRLDNVVILDIDTKANPADLFTKNLGREILRLIRWICGYEPIPPVPDFTTP